jgi:hypothetical protein
LVSPPKNTPGSAFTPIYVCDHTAHLPHYKRRSDLNAYACAFSDVLAYFVFPVGSLGVDPWFNSTEYPEHDVVKTRLIANQPGFTSQWSINTATNYDAMMFLFTAIDKFARLWDKCTGLEWASYPAGLGPANCTAALGSWSDQRWLVNRIVQSTTGYVGISGPVIVLQHPHPPTTIPTSPPVTSYRSHSHPS